MEQIKITKNLKFDYKDLTRQIDLSQEFTLRDIFDACVYSKIPVENLIEILNCDYTEFCEEMISKPFEDEGRIDYLELYWDGSVSEFSGKLDSGQYWAFHGVGKKGVLPDDPNYPYKFTKKEAKEFREKYAIEFTPMYQLADYPIKISDKLSILDYREKHDKRCLKIIDFAPSITLIELLYAIFWELSFCGGIAGRDKKKGELNSALKEFDEAKKNGTLDKKFISSKKLKKDLLKKIKSKKKTGKRGKRKKCK